MINFLAEMTSLEDTIADKIIENWWVVAVIVIILVIKVVTLFRKK